MRFGGLFLLRKDAPGCSFALGWGLSMLLRRVSARTERSGEEQRHVLVGESHTRARRRILRALTSAAGCTKGACRCACRPKVLE